MIKFNKIVLLIFGMMCLIAFMSILLLIPSNRKQDDQGSVLPAPTTVPLEIPKTKNGAGVETEEFKAAEKKYIEEHPILQKLPAENYYFGVEYIDESKLIIHSKTEDKNRAQAEAKAWFILNDIDESKIKVEYK